MGIYGAVYVKDDSYMKIPDIPTGFTLVCCHALGEGGVGWKDGTRPLGPKEIDGPFVLPCKASLLLTGHLITG